MSGRMLVATAGRFCSAGATVATCVTTLPVLALAVLVLDMSQAQFAVAFVAALAG